MNNGDYMSNEHLLLIYSNLDKPYDFGDGDPVFSASLGIDKNDSEQVEALQAIISDTFEEYKSAKGISEMDIEYTSPLKDGDVEKSNKPEYKGFYYINAYAGEKVPPILIDQEKNEIGGEEFHRGDTVRCMFTFFGYGHDSDNGYGVGVRLKAVKLVNNQSSAIKKMIIDAM